MEQASLESTFVGLLKPSGWSVRVVRYHALVFGEDPSEGMFNVYGTRTCRCKMPEFGVSRGADVACNCRSYWYPVFHI